MSNTPFIVLQESLARVGAICGAPESHGTLCGALCAGADRDDAWLEYVLGEDVSSGAAAEDCRRLLKGLQDETRLLLRNGNLEFAPFLPDDDAALEQRTAALAEWCQGYLYGLGLGGRQVQLENLAEEAGEVLRDMTEIARVGFEGEAENEENEAAYTEIVEYLRVGVQLLYEELQPSASGSMPPPASLH
jgi:uncharacterized protein YgfB (UPF0149 family)